MSTTEAPPEDQVARQVDTAIGDTPAAAETNAADALRWFEIVDVPETGFRAFVRLANDHQHQDIREKALAAKARRIRALRNPETDAWEVLEFEMNMIAEAEGATDNLVFELLLERSDRDRHEAINEVNEQEKYKHIQQDQERFRELSPLPDEERPTDEWKELVEHLASYAREVEAEIERVQKPRREALENAGLTALLDKVRERRIDAEGRRVFMDTFTFWQTYVGTLAIPEGFDADHITQATMPRERIFTEESQLRDIDPLIGARLAEAFENLEGALASLTPGNS